MYRVRSSGEVKSQGEIRKLFPNTSLPRVWNEAVCNQLGIDPVLESPAPTGHSLPDCESKRCYPRR
jgi:hypothetical protein